MRNIRFRGLAAVLGVAAALVLLANAVEARPGGSTSSGSRGSRTFSAPPSTQTAPNTAAPIQRTMTQPGATTTASPAAPAAASGGLFGGRGMMGGLMGGLAAGFIGAGLFGMLSGQGFMGGLGGFASFLGLLLQVGLVALIGMLAWRWWQRRSEPATASGPALRNITPDRSVMSGLGLGGGSGAAVQPAPKGVTDEIGIAGADYDAFEHLLGEVQTAYSAEDLTALRAHVTPEMLSYFSEDLAKNASKGVVNQISGVKLLKGDLAEAWREGGAEYATVAMHYALDDRTIERASGRVIEGGEQEVTELWTFMRSGGGAWLLSAIQQT
jgi:predicted lipid-binding transport protein (Tim44 family)